MARESTLTSEVMTAPGTRRGKRLMLKACPSTPFAIARPNKTAFSSACGTGFAFSVRIESGVYANYQSVNSVFYSFLLLFHSSSFSSFPMENEKLLSEKLLPLTDYFVESPEESAVSIVSLYPRPNDDHNLLAENENVHTAKQVRGLSSTYVSRLICITQNHSFRPMNVTHETMRAIVDEHGLGEEMSELASSFWWKVTNVEEAMCLPLQMYRSRDTLAYCYIFRYPDETGRLVDKWSIRQTAIYHHIRLSDMRSTYVMISPYQSTPGQTAAMQWLRGLNTRHETMLNAFDIHDIVFSSYLKGYRAFTTCYEKEIEELSLKMLCYGLQDADTVTIDDMAALNHVQRKMVPIPSILASFEQTLDGLERTFKRFRETKTPASTIVTDPMNTAEKTSSLDSTQMNLFDGLWNYRARSASYRSHIAAVTAQADVASQLLVGILDFHNRNVAGQQNARVALLASFTGEDSVTVRVMAAITLGFLSFTVVAAIVAMPLFYLDPSTHDLAVSPSIWIYLVICVALTFATVGTWQYMLRRRQGVRRKQLQDAELGSYQTV